MEGRHVEDYAMCTTTGFPNLSSLHPQSLIRLTPGKRFSNESLNRPVCIIGPDHAVRVHRVLILIH